MHAGIPLALALPERFHACVAGSRVVIAEADPADLSEGGLERLAMFSENGSLQDKMPAATWSALTQSLRAAIPPPLLSQIRPWMVLSLLTQKRIEELGRSNGSVAMDVALIGIARSRNMDLRFLETAAEQIALMNGLPEASQIRFLRDMIENPQTTDRMIRDMLEAYESGDADRMTRVIFRPDYMREFPEFFSRVYADRNRRWRPVLSSEVQRGRAFIAVGLAHLLGTEGLLAMLRRDGVPVTRVSATHHCTPAGEAIREGATRPD